MGTEENIGAVEHSVEAEVEMGNQLVQQLKPHDHHIHRSFADWALQQMGTDPMFYRKIMFSMRLIFWLNVFGSETSPQ